MSMKKKLRKAYESAAPDVWGRVVQACSDQKLPPYEAAPSQRSVKGNLPNWLTETLGVTAAVALLICVIIGGAWFVSHYGLSPFEDNPPIQTSEPTETTLPSETTQPTQTAMPTETTEIPIMSADAYALSPDGYKVFVFDGIRQPYQGSGPELDLSVLTENYLYVHDQTVDTVYPLSDSEVGCYDITFEHIYYVNSDHSEIIRSDYTAQGQTVLYQSENEITWFDYYGFNAEGWLLVVEDQTKVILLSLATGTSETLMEQYYIEEAYYDATSLSYTSEDMGATIMWHGKITEDGEYSTYIYYVETKENEEPTWH